MSTEAWPPPSTSAALPGRCRPPELHRPGHRAPAGPRDVGGEGTSWPDLDGFTDDVTPVLLGWAGGGLTWWSRSATGPDTGPVGPEENTA